MQKVLPMEKKPIPPWAWLFAVACGIIPVMTLGGAIPGGIGFGGAGGCLAIARDSSRPLPVRVLLCTGITLLCWGLLIVLVGGVAAFGGRPRAGG
jgi:hypothetical protein